MNRTPGRPSTGLKVGDVIRVGRREYEIRSIVGVGRRPTMINALPTDEPRGYLRTFQWGHHRIEKVR